MAIHVEAYLFYLIILVLGKPSEEVELLHPNTSNEAGDHVCDSTNTNFHAVSRNKSSCVSPWTYCDNQTCKCGRIPEHSNVLSCEINTNSTLLTFNCLTYDKASGAYEMGGCIYSVPGGTSTKIYTTLPKFATELNEFTCGGKLNRNGTLCGKCKEGHYPLAHSFNMSCVRCPNGKSNWWKYVLAAYLPLTVFYFVVLFFRINITLKNKTTK